MPNIKTPVTGVVKDHKIGSIPKEFGTRPESGKSSPQTPKTLGGKKPY